MTIERKGGSTMTERDEEGRPIATKNAGAFFSPPSSGGGGMYPVPSSVIDQRGASVEHPREVEVERRGSHTSVEAQERPRPVSERQSWTYAVITATAVWALGFGLLQLVVDGSKDWADRPGPTSGTQLLSWLHTDVAVLLVALVGLVVGIRVGATFLTLRTIRSLSILAGLTLIGAVVIAWAVTAQGGAAGALITIGCALAWLAAAYQIRPL